MTQPTKRLIKFDPTISWGHIATIFALLLTVSAAYYQLKLDARENKIAAQNEIAQVRAEIEIASLQTLMQINQNSQKINNQGEIIAIQLANIVQIIRDLRADFQESLDSGPIGK